MNTEGFKKSVQSSSVLYLWVLVWIFFTHLLGLVFIECLQISCFLCDKEMEKLQLHINAS